MEKPTRKNVLQVIVAAVILCALGIWGYSHRNIGNFAEDWQNLQRLSEAESDTYEIDLQGMNGTHGLSDAENKKRLLQLIVAEAEKGEEQELPDAHTPALGIRCKEKENGFQAMFWVYDFGEETDLGLFQTESGSYLMKNCGEIFNYLTELGCITER